LFYNAVFLRKVKTIILVYEFLYYKSIVQFLSKIFLIKNNSMDHSIKIPVIIILFISLTPSFYFCKKEKKPDPPIITTTSVTEISDTTAKVEGDVTSDGGAPIIYRGICCDTSENATIDNIKASETGGTGTFAYTIASLTPITRYYARAYARNSAGIGYGNNIMFKTTFNPIIFNPGLLYGTVSDVEGNQYKTIAINTQVWMAENLRSTKYNDETAIQLVTDYSEWDALSTPAYCWPWNYIMNKNLYGAMYNGYTVSTCKLCPTGWHVPTDDEWHKLVLYLDPAADLEKSNIAGGKLKETGTTHWYVPNEGATNEVGFTALPGGARNSFNGGFSSLGGGIQLWSSSETDSNTGILFSTDFRSGMLLTYIDSKRWGLFIRCMKN
jgi:uncharacterized protein (TIGR02145 family)